MIKKVSTSSFRIKEWMDVLNFLVEKKMIDDYKVERGLGNDFEITITISEDDEQVED